MELSFSEEQDAPCSAVLQDHVDNYTLPSPDMAGLPHKEPSLDPGYSQYPLYVRPEYDPTYRRILGKAVRPGNDRTARPRARLVVYLLVGSLLACGGVMVGGFFSLSYLQQAMPQIYSRYVPAAVITAKPTPSNPSTTPAPLDIPVTSTVPSVPSVPAAPTRISGPIAPTVESRTAPDGAQGTSPR